MRADSAENRSELGPRMRADSAEHPTHRRERAMGPVSPGSHQRTKSPRPCSSLLSELCFARPEGFEPPTTGFEVRSSIQLS